MGDSDSCLGLCCCVWFLVFPILGIGNLANGIKCESCNDIQFYSYDAASDTDVEFFSFCESSCNPREATNIDAGDGEANRSFDIDQSSQITSGIVFLSLFGFALLFSFAACFLAFYGPSSDADANADANAEIQIEAGTAAPAAPAGNLQRAQSAASRLVRQASGSGQRLAARVVSFGATRGSDATAAGVAAAAVQVEMAVQVEIVPPPPTASSSSLPTLVHAAKLPHGSELQEALSAMTAGERHAECCICFESLHEESCAPAGPQRCIKNSDELRMLLAAAASLLLPDWLRMLLAALNCLLSRVHCSSSRVGRRDAAARAGERVRALFPQGLRRSAPRQPVAQQRPLPDLPR